jgi:hypothetical protein
MLLAPTLAANTVLRADIRSDVNKKIRPAATGAAQTPYRETHAALRRTFPVAPVIPGETSSIVLVERS